MPCQRVQIDLAFDADSVGNCTRPGAQAKYDALLAALAAARPFAVWLTPAEDGCLSQHHLCGHPEGAPCPPPADVGVRPAKLVAVPAEAVPIGEDAEELP